MLSDREITYLADEVAKRLTKFGFDVSNPLDMQKDFAHLRRGREAAERLGPLVRKATLGAVITTAVGGAGLFILAVIQAAWKSAGNG